MLCTTYDGPNDTPQKVLLAMNNQFEGRTFVNQNFTSNITTAEYVHSLFPSLSTAQSRVVASMYEGVGFNTVFDQVVQVMGDCESNRNCAMLMPIMTNQGAF